MRNRIPTLAPRRNCRDNPAVTCRIPRPQRLCLPALAALLLQGASFPTAHASHSLLARAWQTSEGLPHNSPTVARQAPDGFLWIATNSGVARFDGIRFENFSTHDGLPDNQVLTLLVDSKARVWVGTARGIAVRQNGQWHVPPGLAINAPAWTACETPDGAILFGTRTGILRWTGHANPQWIENLPNPNVRDLEVTGDGAVWVVSPTGINRWENNQLTPATEINALIADREVWGMAPGPNNQWLVFGANLLLTGSPGSWTDLSTSIPTRGGIHISAAITPDGCLWVATRNRGVCHLHDHVWTSIDSSSGLSHDDVRDVQLDHEGGLWVATNGGGINRVRHRRFDVFGNEEGLGKHVTTALACDAEGTLWAGTDGGGLKRFDGTRFVPAIPPPGLPDPFVWSLLPQPGDGIWIGSFRDGLVRWKDQALDPLSPQLGLTDGWIPALMLDRHGSTWIGANSGSVYQWQNGKLHQHRGSPGVRSQPITALLEDQQGTVWMGTAGDGLWKWQDQQWHDLRKQGAFTATNVTALLEDPQGHLWIGTANAGLAMCHNGRFHAWNSKHGLACDSILQILDDPHGNLWLGTDVGLQRVTIKELLEVAHGERSALLATDLFGRADGLASPQFSSGHGNLTTRTPGGDLWFSLASGAIRIQPDGIPSPNIPLPLHIESVIAGRQRLWHHESQPKTRGITTHWPAPPLELRFAAPSFTNPEKLRFRYRLTGLDDSWHDAQGSRTATFSSLPPGNFLFEVMATHPGSPWSGDPATLAIEVKPRFWQQAWFQIACAAASAAIIALAVRWISLRRLQHRMKILEQERKVEAERARIAQDLHDDLGATLTEINFLGVLGAASAASPATRQRLEGIVERAQRMAKSLDEIVWTVNPTNDSLSSTVSYLCSRTQESLATGGLRCRLDVAEDMPAAELDSEVRHHLLMAVNEAVNNAMKHARASELRLGIRHHRGSLIITIADNGCGFDPTSLPPGRHGLHNVQQRMHSVGGSCTITSAPTHGARIELLLPLDPQPHSL